MPLFEAKGWMYHEVGHQFYKAPLVNGQILVLLAYIHDDHISFPGTNGTKIVNYSDPEFIQVVKEILDYAA